MLDFDDFKTTFMDAGAPSDALSALRSGRSRAFRRPRRDLVILTALHSGRHFESMEAAEEQLEEHRKRDTYSQAVRASAGRCTSG